MFSTRTILVTLGSIAGALVGRLMMRAFGLTGLTMLGCMAGAIAGYLISTRYVKRG